MSGSAPKRVLDLFCGAGGAAMGLHLAWPEAEIVGVDIKPQPRYPFTFIQSDVFDFLEYGDLMASCLARDEDFIWASPLCQAHSRLNGINGRKYPKYISKLRFKLMVFKVPYAIENVVGAPLQNPTTLCGSMDGFGLGVWRHRIVECSFPVVQKKCRHWVVPEPLDVTGTGGPCATRKTPGGGLHRKPRNMAQASLAMGIDWMIRRELTQAVPPAYSRYIAEQYIIARTQKLRAKSQEGKP